MRITQVRIGCASLLIWQNSCTEIKKTTNHKRRNHFSQCLLCWNVNTCKFNSSQLKIRGVSMPGEMKCPGGDLSAGFILNDNVEIIPRAGINATGDGLCCTSHLPINPPPWLIGPRRVAPKPREHKPGGGDCVGRLMGGQAVWETGFTTREVGGGSIHPPTATLRTENIVRRRMIRRKIGGMEKLEALETQPENVN